MSGYIAIGQGLANISCERSDSKYFRFCRAYSLYLALPRQDKTGHRHCANKWAWLCSNKTYLQKQVKIEFGLWTTDFCAFLRSFIYNQYILKYSIIEALQLGSQVQRMTDMFPFQLRWVLMVSKFAVHMCSCSESMWFLVDFKRYVLIHIFFLIFFIKRVSENTFYYIISNQII